MRSHNIYNIKRANVYVKTECFCHQNPKDLSVALCVSPAARHGVSSLWPAQSHEGVEKKNGETSLGGDVASCAMTSERFRTYRVRVSI